MKNEKRENRKRKLPSAPKGSPAEVSSSKFEPPTVPLESIVSAELLVEPDIQTFANAVTDPIRHVCMAADKQVRMEIKQYTYFL